MGKVSPISIKYKIRAKFTAQGLVEKPDVIGAIFGQTEGLLGEDLELRELQKNGKIGRIDVELKASDSKTEGIIEIPASLDKSETAIIAAAIETIDKIGPCDVKVEIESIEDVRGGKRDYVMERAKKLLQGLASTSPDSREIESAVSSSVRTGRIVEWGEEKLPAGPEIDSSNEIIIVEGRADVVNVLDYGIKNAIAMNGASMPKTLKELSKTKEVTLFIDGDRGGILNAKDAIATAKIKYVAQAPDGKEVEELSGKEIVSCLRAKITVEDFEKEIGKKQDRGDRDGEERNDRDRGYRSRGGYGRGRGGYSRGRGGYGRGGSYSHRYERDSTEKSENEAPAEPAETKALTESDMKKIRQISSEIKGTRKAFLADKNLEKITVVQTSSAGGALMRNRGRVYVTIIDGTATSYIIRAAERSGCRNIAARNFEINEDTSINLISQ